MPVRAGDVIGTAASDGQTVSFTGAAGDSVVLLAGDQPAGSSGVYAAVQQIRMDVTATIEPDADHDGYTNREDYINALVDAQANAVLGEPRASTSGTDYATLQEAIDALPAQGGEVLLAPGVYREKVLIDKPNVQITRKNMR